MVSDPTWMRPAGVGNLRDAELPLHPGDLVAFHITGRNGVIVVEVRREAGIDRALRLATLDGRIGKIQGYGPVIGSNTTWVPPPPPAPERA